MYRMSPLLLLCAALLGCSAPSDPPLPAVAKPTQSAAMLATCGADRHQGLIGASFEQLLKVEILGPVRTIRPGDPVTEDFRPNRLNISLSHDDTVAAVYCS